MAGLALLAAGGLTGKARAAAIENQLVIYNWSQYDDPRTYKDFKKAHPGTSIHETYYSSNDELLAKLQAGGSGYDIVVPSQNAVGELIELKKLLKLDKSLLPNYVNYDPAWKKTSYDPTDDYKVVKDYGITMFFYRNDIVKERPQTMLDFYKLLPKYGKKGRTNLMDGAEEVVPIALMALGLDPNTDSSADFKKVQKFLLSIRSGVTTITSSDYINDGSAGKIILGQGWNGDVRRIVQARKKQGDITAVIPHGASEKWADNWCILAERAASEGGARVDQLPAHTAHRGAGDAVPQLRDSDGEGPGSGAEGASERPDVQRSDVVHERVPLHPQPDARHREPAHDRLHEVQGRLR